MRKKKHHSETESSAHGVKEVFRNSMWAFKETMRASPGPASGLLLMALLNGVLPPSILVLTKRVIDAATGLEVTTLSDVSVLLPLGALLATAILLDNSVSAFQSYFGSRLYDDLNLTVSQDLLEHAATLDMAYFEDPDSQDVLQRAQQNPANQFEKTVTRSLQIISTGIKMAALFAILVAIEPWVFAFAAVLTPLYLIFYVQMSTLKYEMEFKRTTKRRMAKYYASHLTSRNLVLETKVLGLESLLIERCRELMVEFLQEDRSIYTRSMRGAVGFVVLSGLLGLGLIGRVAFRALTGSVSFGGIAAFGGGLMQFRSAIEKNVQAVTGIFEGSLYISNYREFMEAEPILKRGVGTVKTATEGGVEVSGLTFRYPGGKTDVLKDVSFSVHPGETIAIVGQNGAGKTTLIKLLMRIYDPTNGSIMLDGIDLGHIEPVSLLHNYSYVPQRFATFEATVHENIAFGDWERLLHDPASVKKIVEDVGIEEMISKLPNGIETVLGRKFGEMDLSGGQWQRIVMARALARPDTILILDEPTSSQDAHGEAMLFESLKRLTHNRTTILISHRFSTVSIADRILVLNEGRIAESGSHEELIQRNGYYAALYDVQVKAMRQSQ